jgi:hypothetical protein
MADQLASHTFHHAFTSIDDKSHLVTRQGTLLSKKNKMKRILVLSIVCFSLCCSCKKDSVKMPEQYGEGPRTAAPPAMQGSWMYGNFSMNEYWSQNPADYLGNAFEFAIAFRLNENGTYEQYFSSRSVVGLTMIYHQSLSKGTIELNPSENSMITHANLAHYKRTVNGITVEDRDLENTEMTLTNHYTYELHTEINGTRAMLLKLNGEGNPLRFLKK